MITRVRWTESAERDLTAIVDYIEADRPAAAIRVASDLFALVSSLSSNPRRGAVVPELRSQGVSLYRQVQSRPYRVIYSIRNGVVVIEAILDSRRNLAAILAERLLR
ncbi:MAG: type II toxin-antitoxin system RelE/ParE family toxin [Bryobacteraceae bacterium]